MKAPQACCASARGTQALFTESQQIIVHLSGILFTLREKAHPGEEIPQLETSPRRTELE